MRNKIPFLKSISAIPVLLIIFNFAQAQTYYISHVYGGCAGQTNLFTFNCYDCTSINWGWTGSAIVESGQGTTNFRIKWNSAGTHQVWVSYSSQSYPYSGQEYSGAFNISNPVTPAVSITSNITSVCQGSDNIIFTASPVNGGSSPSYTWYIDGTNVGSGSSSTFSYSSSSLSPGSHYAYVIMSSNAPCKTQTNATSSNRSFTVSAKKAFSATLTSSPSTVCSGNPNVTFYAQASATTGNITYQWYMNGSQVATGNPYSSSVSDGTTIYCVVSTDEWCINSPATTSTYTADVTPQVTPTVTVYSPPVSFCPGEQIPFSVSSPYITSSSTYIWYLNGGQVSAASNAQSINITAKSSAEAGYYYPGSTVSVTVYNLSGTCLASTTASDAANPVEIKPMPTASADNQTTCSGQTTSISISNPNAVPGTTYSWTAVASNVTGSANGSGNLIAQQLTATTTSNGTVDYTITPYANGCPGPSITRTVTVKPKPTVAVSLSSQLVCSGLPMTPVDISNPNAIPGTTFLWTVSAPNISGASSGSGSQIGQTLSQSTATNQIATYTVTATANSCSSIPASTSVTVKPKPTVAVSLASQSICSGQEMTQVDISNPNAVAGTTFDWTVLAPNISNAAGGSGSSIKQTLSQSTSTIQNATYTIVAKANSCESTPITTTVSVKPIPDAAVSANFYLFSGSTTNISITNPNGVSGTIFNWTVSPVNVSGGSSGTGSSIQQVLTSTNGGAATYLITPAANECNGIPISTQATVYAKPIITATSDRIVLASSTLLSTSGDYETYTWKDGNDAVVGDDQNLTIGTPGSYTVTVTKTGVTGTSQPFDLKGQFSGQNANYIVSYNVLREGVTSKAMLETLPVEEVTQSVQYFDGLGRPIQNVITQGSPSKHDVVQPFTYDEYGRESRKYLPFVPAENSGLLKSDVINKSTHAYQNAAANFYATGAGTIPIDSVPYAETIFEASTLNRVLKQGAPGQGWQPNNDPYSVNDNTKKYRYGANMADEVLLWAYDPSTHRVSAKIANTLQYYEKNALNVNTTYDEHNNMVLEYISKEGKTILKRVQATTTQSIINDTTFASTYYIYDNFGNLATVLPPEAVSKLSTLYHNAMPINQNKFLRNWAFRYKYDERGRMTEKQVPGSGTVYMVYDSRDRLVLTQDSLLRQASPYKWLFTKYDELNRPILTGIKDTTALLSQSEMQDRVNAFYAKPSAKWGERFVGTGSFHGYTNQTYPVVTSGNTVVYHNYLTVTYYDDYSFLINLSGDYLYKNEGLSKTVDGEVYSQPALQHPRVTGQVTGNKVRVMDGNILAAGYTWLSTVNYYDDRLRLIQTISDNYKGGGDRVTNLYDFSGKLLKSKKAHYVLTFKDLVGTRQVANKLDKTLNTNAWDAGSASVEVLPANQDGWLQFIAASTNKAMMIGFSETNPDANWNKIKYALYLKNDGKVEIREYGSANLLASLPSYAIGDVFRVERKVGKIRFYKNGVFLLERSATLNPLLIDLSIHGSQGKFYDVRSSFGSFSSTDIIQTFEYDHAGRLIDTWHQIDNGPNILLAHNEYNAVGQLVDKTLHSTGSSASDAKQSVDYRYNIRGWLTSMNNSSLVQNETNDDVNDYFGFELEYNSTSGLGNEQMYNGNISSMKWSSDLGLGAEKAYVYTYDALNRITGATYKRKYSEWAVPTADAFSESGYTYDLNGNIKTLKRFDERGNTGIMDHLSYIYGTGIDQSNKLLKVSEQAGGDAYRGFVDGTNSGNDYTYDANGNMITDQNKGITSNMIYNFLNLPQTVSRGGNTLNYVYDATGRKLLQVFSSNGTDKLTDYAQEFQYENNSLRHISQEEGRIVVSSTQSIFSSDCESLSGMAGINGAIAALVIQNGNQTYVRYTSNGSNWGGVLLNGAIAASPGDIFKIRVKGYRTGSNPVYILAKTNLGNILPQAYGPSLPSSLSSEAWVEQTVTIPPGATQFLAHVVYYLSSSGAQFFLNDVEVTKITLNTTPEYQYHLKDHLGNVRLTFTTKPETHQNFATLETVNAFNERSQFLNYDEAIIINYDLFDHTYEGTTGQTYYSTRLTGGNTNAIYGLAKSLSVMAGDTINMSVFAKYLDPNSSNWSPALTNFMAAVAGGTAPPGTMVDGGSPGSLGSGTFPFAGTFNHSSEGGTAPKAYLNFIVFDRDYNPIIGESGFIRITTAARESGSNVAHEKLERASPLVIKEPGYVYIYLSNENETPVEVYFDDFNVEHIKSPVVQMDDYYPFGLTFNSYQRENSVDQRYLYNGKEVQDELQLGWFDYGARMLDPSLGRWFVIDNLADHPNQISWTPYHYVKNNPTNSTDPDGNCGDCFLDLAFILYDVGEIAYDYVTTGKVDPVSVAALSADAVALATPVVTGAGVAVRLAKEGGEQVAKQIAKEGAEKVVKETGEKAAKETGEKASKQEARFVADTDGKIIDTKATPKGSYNQPDGSRTDILQDKPHFNKKQNKDHGTSHTHETYSNTNPRTGETRTGTDRNNTHLPTYEEIMNVINGTATKQK